MFARFDENPAMTLQDIKETKHYGWMDAHTDGRKSSNDSSRYQGNKTLRTDGCTDGQRENSIPTTNKVCGRYNKYIGMIRVNIYIEACPQVPFL